MFSIEGGGRYNLSELGQYTLMEESVCGRHFCGFWKICKSLFLQKLRSIVNRKSFFLQNIQIFSTAKVYCRKKTSNLVETRKFFPAKCSNFFNRKSLLPQKISNLVETRKFFPAKYSNFFNRKNLLPQKTSNFVETRKFFPAKLKLSGL